MTSRILIVDDEESILDFVCMGLQHEGFETLTAASGRGALEQFRTASPHLVILDWLLPDLDGIAVCRSLRSISAVPIIMLTAKGEIDDKVLGLESGADDYLPKPFKFREDMEHLAAQMGDGADRSRSKGDAVLGPRRLDNVARSLER